MGSEQIGEDVACQDNLLPLDPRGFFPTKRGLFTLKCFVKVVSVVFPSFFTYIQSNQVFVWFSRVMSNVFLLCFSQQIIVAGLPLIFSIVLLVFCPFSSICFFYFFSNT